jgi:hypothetical protein
MRKLDKNTDTKSGHTILDNISNLLTYISILIAAQNVSTRIMLIGNAFTCLIK